MKLLLSLLLLAGCSSSDFASNNASDKKNPDNDPTDSSKESESDVVTDDELDSKKDGISDVDIDVDQQKSDSVSIKVAEGLIKCQFKGPERILPDWTPLVNAPAGYLAGKNNPENLKDDQDIEANLVLASAPDLSVGGKIALKEFALTAFELYNDTGEINHFGKGWAVEVSSDGKTWKIVEEKMEGKHHLQRYDFKLPISSNHVRLRLLELPQGPGWDVLYLRFFGKDLQCK